MLVSDRLRWSAWRAAPGSCPHKTANAPPGGTRARRVIFCKGPRNITMSVDATLRTALEREELEAFRFAAQDVTANAGHNDTVRYRSAVQ